MHKINITPPRPAKKSTTLEKHGDKRQDDYFWLKERENPEVVKYLESENKYTEEIFSKHKKLEDKLFTELKSRIKEDETFVPYKNGNYYYSARYETGLEYPLYIRFKGSPSATEEIILNGPELAKGQSYFNTGGPDISTNHNMMAYAIDNVGRRMYTIYFKDLEKNKVLPQKIENTTGNIVWANDNKTIFYTQQNPDTLRSEKVFRYNLDTQKSELVYHEKDETFSVYVYKTLPEKFIYIGCYATLESEILYINADHPTEKPKVFSKRSKEHQYAVTDDGHNFYVTTNRNAPNFKVMTADAGHTEEKNWKPFLPHSEKIFIDDINIFKNFIAIEERSNGLTQIRVLDRNGKNEEYLKFDDSSYVVSIGTNAEFDTEKLRYNYQSLRIPSSIYYYDIKSKKSEFVHRQEVPNYDPEKYKTERVFIKVRDGAEVPVSLLMKKDFNPDSSSHMLIYGYGSYGANMDPYFNSDWFSLIDRGFVFAKANIRGGSELGRQWYDQGRTYHKMNTFNDFIDVTEALQKKGYSTPEKTFAMGGSAGGLLMGAIMNMRPELYNGIVAQVPFVDVITTMLDDSIPLTTGEYDQWGNPNDAKAYSYIRQYSPYDNIKKQKYPNTLVTTGFHDSQVQYWEPAKWVPKLRENNTGDTTILLKTNMDAGHGGASGRFESLKEATTEFAFILMNTNIDK